MNQSSNKRLVIHCHTTGINYGGDDITLNNQALSIALGVVNMTSLKIENQLNVNIKFNGEKYVWSDKLVSIHGISKQDALDGEDEYHAIEMIAEFLYNNFGSNPIQLIGYNSLSFHVPFLNKLLKSEDIEFKFDHKEIDLYSIMAILNKEKVRDMFDLFGIDSSIPLSSLQHIKYYIKIYKAIKSIINESING